MKKSPENPKVYECYLCDYVTSAPKDYHKHCLTKKHLDRQDSGTNGEDKSPKIPKPTKNYECELCNYTTTNAKDYNKHLSTSKHQDKANGNTTNDYKCDCGRYYMSYGSLWRHKKVCNIAENTINENTKLSNTLSVELVIELVKNNKELQELMREDRKMFMEEIRQLKQGTYGNLANPPFVQNANTISNTSNNFNLNFFLNEQCKNAINLSDFINSLVVTAQDFERTGKVGFVEGISKIFLNGLRALDVYSRPIHCTDLKRESIYVKQDNVWVKEDSEKTHLNTAVKQLARKNLRQLVTWKAENPDCLDTSTPASDLLVTFSQTALGGIGEQEDAKFRSAIIKNIVKDVVIDKTG